MVLDASSIVASRLFNAVVLGFMCFIVSTYGLWAWNDVLAKQINQASARLKLMVCAARRGTARPLAMDGWNVHFSIASKAA
jgi:uncharacterized membrane protein